MSIEHQDETRYFYLGLAAGFVLGLWLVFVVFLFGKACRVAFFHLFDKLLHAIQAFMGLFFELPWKIVDGKTEPLSVLYQDIFFYFFL